MLYDEQRSGAICLNLAVTQQPGPLRNWEIRRARRPDAHGDSASARVRLIAWVKASEGTSVAMVSPASNSSMSCSLTAAAGSARRADGC